MRSTIQTHDLELAIVIHALKTCWHYEEIDINSDHKSLEYIFTQRDLNIRKRRWMEYMANYNFTLHDHPSKKNAVADALSRKSHVVLASVII